MFLYVLRGAREFDSRIGGYNEGSWVSWKLATYRNISGVLLLDHLLE